MSWMHKISQSLKPQPQAAPGYRIETDPMTGFQGAKAEPVRESAPKTQTGVSSGGPKEWYLDVNGEWYGPMDIPQLLQFAKSRSGTDTAYARVAKRGDTTHRYMYQIPGIEGYRPFWMYDS